MSDYKKGKERTKGKKREEIVGRNCQPFVVHPLGTSVMSDQR